MSARSTFLFFTYAMLCMLVAALLGCSSRPHVKPRSVLVEESESMGIFLPTPEEEKLRFVAYQKQQENRFRELIARRGGGSFRDPSYKIGAADKIEVAVFDVPELNVTAMVRQSGFLSLPLLGAVRAAGLTEQELADEISGRLKEFMHTPEVSVFVADYGSQKVAVIGSVQAPGRYALKKGANSILELISEAGGLTDKAGSYLNFIPGDLSGVTQIDSYDQRAQARYDHAALGSGLEQNHAVEVPLELVLGTHGGVPLELPVKHGDMIIIPEAGSVQVDGEVLKTGTYVLGRKMTLLGALAASGGITYGAKIDEIEVVRDLNGEPVHLVVDLERVATGMERDVLLKNGDIVRIPSHGGRRLRQDTFEAVTRIINFGVGGTFNVAQ